MGVVYKARHVLIDKAVAIKILRKEAAQDTAAVQRFIQEAKSASKINHSNIVDITDFGVLPDGHAYFVMEFLEGKTLAQVIQEGPMDAKRVCNIGGQVARGLHAAHQKGIVHRDLKPENIFLLEREGQSDYVKIVDFGIAKVGGGQKLTQAGMVLGTPEYMSPEQATGQETDHRVDQYALGCIMYEMLTGVVPFLGDRPAQTLTKHVFEPVTPPRKRKPDLKIPASLDGCVLRTMQKKAETRFPSMKDLDSALMQVEAELKGGRVVIDDPGMAAAQVAATAPPPPPSIAPGAVPPPAPSIAPGVLAGGPPVIAAPSYYPNQANAPATFVVPQPAPILPGLTGGLAGGAKRGPGIVVGMAGALLVAIGMLVYFVTRPPTPPIKPPPIVTPKIETPKIETPSTPPVPPPEQVAMDQLQVLSIPPDAEVFIDGNLVGKTPVQHKFKRGTRLRVEVRKRGFDSYEHEISPKGDQTLDVTLSKQGHSSSGSKKPGKSDAKGTTTTTPPVKTTATPSGLRDPFNRNKK
jgi:serine/threonine-protein kinase